MSDISSASGSINKSEMDPEVLAIHDTMVALEGIGSAGGQARVIWFVAERLGLLDSLLTMAARRYETISENVRR